MPPSPAALARLAMRQLEVPVKESVSQMMHNDEQDADLGATLVSVRTMEIVVALLLLFGSAVVIYDSVRVGHTWQDGVGPAAGYFPFYVAVLMGISSLIILATALFKSTGKSQSFVSTVEFRRVLAVLVPSIVYVALIHLIGIYVASAIFIVFFMLTFGRESIWKAAAVGIGVPLVLFMMFERWFLVPLPKGPLEALLGFS